jgi:hypothetical protein
MAHNKQKYLGMLRRNRVSELYLRGAHRSSHNPHLLGDLMLGDAA